ncbi:hypothetical protein DFH09DRAFT_1335451 [Mycena vulgaris]|nr:hypothetical protein DFH09DRAFT_1335451 [Mycena vulgaris]
MNGESVYAGVLRTAPGRVVCSSLPFSPSSSSPSLLLSLSIPPLLSFPSLPSPPFSMALPPCFSALTAPPLPLLPQALSLPTSGGPISLVWGPRASASRSRVRGAGWAHGGRVAIVRPRSSVLARSQRSQMRGAGCGARACSASLTRPVSRAVVSAPARVGIGEIRTPPRGRRDEAITRSRGGGGRRTAAGRAARGAEAALGPECVRLCLGRVEGREAWGAVSWRLCDGGTKLMLSM